MKTLNRQSVYFTGPGAVEVRTEILGEPGPGQALVKTILTGISSGTESLIYQNQFPEDLPLDTNISALSDKFQYPLKYGYAAVGEVIALGPGISTEWLGRQVFAFNPHESHFIAETVDLFPIPEDLPAEEAVFLPNMETAVNLVMDGGPLLGENVTIFGQGVVGLLTTALLAQFPLGQLITIDRFPDRRRISLELGAQASINPDDPDLYKSIQAMVPGGADLCFEVSGASSALDQAIAITGYTGRVVIGSWYGLKRANLNLGGWFHRSRIELISSQVSTLAPELSGRWNKARRFQVAWKMLQHIRPAQWISHRFSVNQAPQAYQLLSKNPEDCLQVIFTYP